MDEKVESLFLYLGSPLLGYSFPVRKLNSHLFEAEDSITPYNFSEVSWFKWIIQVVPRDL